MSGGTGDDAPDRLELVMLLCRLKLCDCGIESWRGWLFLVRSAVEGVYTLAMLPATPPVVDDKDTAAVLCVLVEEEER